MRAIFLILICFIWSYTQTQMPNQTNSMKTYKYLALGDSYTIGEAVSETERWPVQLVERLGENGVKVENPRIIATTGWTTYELQQAINDQEPSSDYDLVSLLIGVNNQYRGYDIQQYEREFVELLEQAISFARGIPSNVFVVSIPDYGVTPFAKSKNLDTEKITSELNNYNQIARGIASSRKVQFFDITEWSRNAANDESLITSDGLHPSGKMYKNWVDTCFVWVLNNVGTR